MSEQPYRVDVGEFVCHVIPDNSIPMSFEGLQDRLSKADPGELRSAFDRRHPEGSFPWAYNPLLVQTPKETILFDSSFGATNELVAQIVAPGDVTHVVITHTHGDHVNGLVDGDGKAVYPNARVTMQKVEWEWWSVENIKSAVEGQLTQVEGEMELVPGVSLLFAPGHTPGHMAVMLESGGERLLHLVDTLHAPVQMERPDWSIRFDSDMDLAAETRRNMLAKAASEDVLTLLYHFAFPGLGHVTKSGDAFDWQPVK